MDENMYLRKTGKGLSGIDEERLAPKGFDIGENDVKKEDCVLIMGLNPAGDKSDAERERDNPYFYYVESLGIEKDWHYAKYYEPIFKLVKETTGCEPKWGWCNKQWSKIEDEINKGNLKNVNKNIGIVKSFYDRIKNAKVTIYIGEMFYYHETNSKKLKTTDYVDGNYYVDMLKMHIKDLKNQHNKNIKYVYINNARASKGLCKDETSIEIDGVKVFLGAMLSNGVMDNFSRQRLINEIKGSI